MTWFLRQPPPTKGSFLGPSSLPGLSGSRGRVVPEELPRVVEHAGDGRRAVRPGPEQHLLDAIVLRLGVVRGLPEGHQTTLPGQRGVVACTDLHVRIDGATHGLALLRAAEEVAPGAVAPVRVVRHGAGVAVLGVGVGVEGHQPEAHALAEGAVVEQAVRILIEVAVLVDVVVLAEADVFPIEGVGRQGARTGRALLAHGPVVGVRVVAVGRIGAADAVLGVEPGAVPVDGLAAVVFDRSGHHLDQLDPAALFADVVLGRVARRKARTRRLVLHGPGGIDEQEHVRRRRVDVDLRADARCREHCAKRQRGSEQKPGRLPHRSLLTAGRS